MTEMVLAAALAAASALLSGEEVWAELWGIPLEALVTPTALRWEREKGRLSALW